MARITVFAFDLTEAAQIRRIRSLRRLGHLVESLAFRRDNMNAGYRPEWPNTDLGTVANERYGRRLLALLRALPRMARARAALRRADVIVARNFDLLVLAWLGRTFFTRRGVPLVYECLDIHGLFTRADAVGRAMRWTERRLLARVDLLIVSSPDFVDSYFAPVQGYRGSVSLIENKLWFDGAAPARPERPPRRDASGPLVLGWVGSIRCGPSLALLIETAERMGGAFEIRIHGSIHRHALPEFDARTAGCPNLSVAGPYSYPDDLGAIYAGCDLVWAQDLWQRGGNSDWLLPNRIYEASWYGCPSVAVADTQTGRRVDACGLGFTIPSPDSASLAALLHRLTRAETLAISRDLLAQDAERFELRPQDVARALDPVLPADPSR